MKQSLFFVLVLTFSFVASQQISHGFSKVIYDTDGRTDSYELSSFDQAVGHSTAILITGFNVLEENNDGTFSATVTATAEDFWGFCPEERYSDQRILARGFGFCSAFLITDQWIGTASHCSESAPSEYIVIFGFELLSSSETRLTFEADDVYHVNDIVAKGVSTGKAGDFGIMELDRRVTKYQPYYQINNKLQPGDQLMLIGHPMGLPKKTDKSGEVTQANENVIRGTVDSYGGNSGSPVFDENGLLAGILVGGSQDFDYRVNCETSNFCPGNSGCEALGEYIVPICTLIQANDEVSERIGIDCGNTEDSGHFYYSSALRTYLENEFGDENSASTTFTPVIILLVILFSFM